MKWKSVWVIFFVTCCFEFTKRVQRRKETPCPYCGFDASWYKTDVKRARKLVDDFWRQEEPPPKASEEDTPAQSDDITS